MRVGTFTLLAAAVAFAEPLSLAEAIVRAREANPQIKKERTAVESAESSRSEARSRFLPEFSISGKVTHIDDDIYLDLNPIRTAMISVHGSEAYSSYYNQYLSQGADAQTAATYAAYAQQQTESSLESALPSFKTKVQDDWFLNLRASVVWPIFTGGKIWSAYKAADENVDAKQAEFDAAESAVLAEVCERYFSLKLAEEMVKLREDSMKNMEEHLERSKKLEDGGQLSYAERLRSEVAFSEAETEMQNAERTASLARLALSNSLHSDTAISATTPIAVPELTESLESWKQRAKSNHPALRQIQVQKKRSKRAITAARGDYFPTLALFGYKELWTRDLTVLEPEWAVGLSMNWVLFKGGETTSKVSNAKTTERSLTFLEEQILEDIGLLVEKRYRELEYAKSRLQSLGKTRALAEESLRSQTKAFESGLATSLDVVDAELSLSRLRIAELKAEYDALMAWIGLLNAAGEISQVGNLMEERS